jgi:LysR family transcriptional regulator, nitrogen assimilation regulatory protein
MDLKGLRYFVHVADVGSVSAAARDLGIVQPALSRHIQRIEDEAGIQLFSRLPRGMELTAAGREFVEHCREICQHVALAKAALGMKGSLPGGQLALGIPSSLAAILVPNLVGKVRDRFPKITVTVIEGTNQQLYGDLLAGRLDIAILNSPPVSSSVKVVFSIDEKIVLLSPPQRFGAKRVCTLEELVKTPLIATREIRTHVNEQIRTRGKVLDVRWEISSIEGIRRLLLAGAGCALAPASTFRDDIAAGQISACPIEDIDLHQTYSLAQLADGVSPSTQALVSVIESEMKALTTEGTCVSIPDGRRVRLRGRQVRSHERLRRGA